MKGWEAETRLRDGQVNVEFTDGSRITVKNDGVTGYAFVKEYLSIMRKNYGSHLLAIDKMLRQDLDSQYKSVKSLPKVYDSFLAVQSINCAFGYCDGILDCDESGEMHPKFTKCPRRAVCRFNGYHERNKGNAVVGCNPVYECGLTPQRAAVANMLVNTGLDYAQIAEVLRKCKRTTEKLGSEVFATIGVNSRAELIQKLKGKRLL